MSWQDNPLARSIIERVSSTAIIQQGRTPFTMLIHFTLLPEAYGSGSALAAVSQPQSRAEPGCISYTWMQHGERRDRLSVYERWRNIEALKFHFGTPHFQEVSRMLEPKIARDPEIEIYADLE
jgi:quinol monooxygenase YgiN